MSTPAQRASALEDQRSATFAKQHESVPRTLDASSDKFGTPFPLFERLSEEYGPFSLDPCPNPKHLLPLIGNFPVTPGVTDGLTLSWEGRRVYVNPPYTNIEPWVRKAVRSVEKKPFSTCIVMLLPAKTDSQWFNFAARNASHIRFITGRLRYAGGASSARFPSMIVVFDRRIAQMWSVWWLSPAERGFKEKK